ncbi:MAG: hypothetical protein OXN17_08210 [Candidatus Poribacteria bacterium]|nr:hypothetical protein [Candidatus Poribacteria bacterium]MDE0505334.1 hypothetical protein [Candidatus Poribacteria bacterium]
MKILCFTLLLAFVMASISFAQYDELAHDVRQISIGIAGMNDDTSVSTAAILPINQNRIEGWGGIYGQQQSSGGEVTSQVLNAHAVIGYAFHERVGVNAFVDWNRDKQRGIAGQTQLGGFVSVDLYEDDGWRVNGGAGNFLENKQAREDLELKDADPNVMRALAYLRAQYSRYSVMYKFTPKIDFSDLQVSIEPVATYTLSDTLSLIVRAKIGYETEPLVEGEEFFTSYQLQLGATF